MNLTEHQLDTLRYVALGKTNGEIASIYGTCENTVKNQVSTLCQKFSVPNRCALVWEALKRGTIEPPVPDTRTKLVSDVLAALTTSVHLGGYRRVLG